MSTKASNPRCKINFVNLTFRILTLQTTWFTANLHDFGVKSRFNFWILILQTSPNSCLQFICMILGLNLDSIFGSWSSKPVALQRICMILGLNLDSVFGSWSFKKDETNVYKCLQKPLIHDVKLILEILLFGSWSSKLPGLQQICTILGQNPDSVLGSLSSKHLQTTLFTIYLHDLGTKSRFSFWILILQTSCFTAYLHDLGTKSRFNFWILILQKKDETNVFKSL